MKKEQKTVTKELVQSVIDAAMESFSLSDDDLKNGTLRVFVRENNVLITLPVKELHSPELKLYHDKLLVLLKNVSWKIIPKKKGDELLYTVCIYLK